MADKVGFIHNCSDRCGGRCLQDLKCSKQDAAGRVCSLLKIQSSVDVLLKLIEKKPVEQSIILPVKFVEGGTTKQEKTKKL